MNFRVILLASALSAGIQATAQNVKGKIVDSSTKEPLEFVNVSLISEKNNKMISGMTSDLDGNFEFKSIEKGNYVLQITFVGYGAVRVPVALTSGRPDFNAGAISLKEDSQLLKEVEVTGQRSQMKFDVDKKVFNVDQNIASAGASASEALSNIPSISVDNEGNVSLRNNSSVTIWINGRPSGLSEDNRAQILEQLSAESIESIEVITNPSSKYSAEGSAGIINIVMKKEKRTGYYGGLSGGADSQGGYSVNGNINVTYNKLEAFANLGYRKRAFNMSNETDRTYLDEYGDPTKILSQDGDGKGGGGGWFGRAGINYNFSNKDVLGFSVSGMTGNRDRDNTLNYTTIYPNDESIETSRRTTDSKNDRKMVNASIDYSHTFGKEHDLKFAATANYNDREGGTLYKQYNEDNLLYNYQDQRTPQNKNGYEAQVDYTNKLSDLLKLEVGYKFDKNNNKYDSDTYTLELLSPVSNIDLSNLPDNSNQSLLIDNFRYDEIIQAAYISGSGKKGNLSYQAGVRAEHVSYETEAYSRSESGSNSGELVANDSEQDNTTSAINKNSYLAFFPSMFLSYSLPHGNEMQINYTRRINRARGHDLNPVKNISDAENISFGNPELRPEYTHAVEMNYIKNWDAHMLSGSVYYRLTEDVIQRISYIQDNVMYTTSDNVTDSYRAGFEIVSKNRLFGFLDLTTSVNGYYYKVNGFTYRYGTGDNDFESYSNQTDFSWDARMIANMMLPAKISLQLTGSYNAPIKNAQGKTYEMYGLDAGIRRSFLNKKLTVAVTARDIFNSRKWKQATYGTGYEQISTRQWGGRQIGFNLSYNFGNMTGSKKPKRQESGDAMGGEMMED